MQIPIESAMERSAVTGWHKTGVHKVRGTSAPQSRRPASNRGDRLYQIEFL